VAIFAIQARRRRLDGDMSKLLIFKPRWGHLGGDIDLIEILHAGRERNAKAKRERDKKELKNRLRLVATDSEG